MGAAISAADGIAIAAAARAADAGPADVAAILRQFPAQQTAIMRWLHDHLGNAYVRQVITHGAPATAPAWTVVANPRHLQFPATAQTLTDRAPDDPATQARVTQFLEPVVARLYQLNDHQGRLAGFGAGNIAGQMALDMSETAVRSWLLHSKRRHRRNFEHGAGNSQIRTERGRRIPQSTHAADRDEAARVVLSTSEQLVTPTDGAKRIEELTGEIPERQTVFWVTPARFAALDAELRQLRGRPYRSGEMLRLSDRSGCAERVYPEGSPSVGGASGLRAQELVPASVTPLRSG
jgi:hypothetical protein